MAERDGGSYQPTHSSRSLTGRLFAYAFLTTLAYMVSRSLSDGLFLGRVGPELLPLVMLGSAAIVIPLTLVWSRLAGRWRLKHIVIVTRLALAATAIVFAAELPLHPDSRLLLSALYVVSELRGCLNTIQFATLLNEAVPSHRRLVTPVAAAGAPLAGIASGVLIGTELGTLSFSQLLWFVAALDLLALWPVSRLAVERGSEGDESLEITNNGSRAYRHPLVNAIAAVVLFQVVVMTLVGYKWKVSAADEFQGLEFDLARYFAAFYAVCDACTLLLQVFYSGSILRTRGLGAALVATPMLLSAILVPGLVVPTAEGVFLLMTLAKGTEILRRGLTEPAVILLYRPLDPSLRRRAISIVSGFVKPVSESIAVLLIFAMTALDADSFRIPVLTAFLMFGWIWVSWRTLAAYSRCTASRGEAPLQLAPPEDSVEPVHADGPNLLQ